MGIFLLASDARGFPHLSPRVLLIVIACIGNHMFLKSSFAEGSVFSVMVLGGGVLSACMFVEYSELGWRMCGISQVKKGHMGT